MRLEILLMAFVAPGFVSINTYPASAHERLMYFCAWEYTHETQAGAHTPTSSETDLRSIHLFLEQSFFSRVTQTEPNYSDACKTIMFFYVLVAAMHIITCSASCQCDNVSALQCTLWTCLNLVEDARLGLVFQLAPIAPTTDQNG